MTTGLQPLSSSQRRLWFIDQLEGDGALNLVVAQRLRGPLNVRRLVLAIDAVVARHDSLRCRFVERDGVPWQIDDPTPRPPLVSVDLDSLADTAARPRVRVAAALMREQRAQRFDLSRGPLRRFVLIRLRPDEHILLSVFHHSIFDGWSRGIFNRELSCAYNSRPLGPAPMPYAIYASWQRQSLDDRQQRDGLAYWTKQLAGLPEGLELQADRLRPARQTLVSGVHRSRLSADQVLSLQQVAREQRVTMYMVLLAGLAELLARHTGQSDIAIGSPISDRRDPRLERVIGCFLNIVVIRVRRRPAMRVRELLADVRRTMLEAFRHQDVPFDRVVEAVAPRRRQDRTPLFQAQLTLQNAPEVELDLDGVDVEPVPAAEGRVGTDIELYATAREGGLQLTWQYNRRLFDAWRIEQMARQYSRLLDGLAGDVNATVACLPLLDDANPASEPLPDVALVEQFERQAERAGDAIAVACGDAAISYRLLNARANIVARRLRRDGVGVEDVVGISLPRSIEMIAALLGVLKAGAAYLPLDPSAPSARLAWMRADAKPRCVLTAVDAPGEESDNLRQDEAARSPQRAAYVIYTSGSTGQPKGVVGLQGGLLNRLDWLAAHEHYRVDGPVLAKSPFTFIDGSTELLGPLLHGGSVVLATADDMTSASRLAALIMRHGIGAITVVPGLLRALLDEAPSLDGHACRRWITSGEALPRADAVAFHATWPDAMLLNLYGASEASGDSLCHHCRADDVAIGTPIARTQVYLLDRNLALVPVGVTGELYVSGDGLARGYLGQPAATAARFLPNPFGGSGRRMYRTGDLARQRRDGCMEFLGRRDDQVKIRGFRVEPGEVRSALRTCDNVVDAAVVACPDACGEPRLVGYVVSAPGAAVDPRAVRDQLRTILPDYMMPWTIVPIAALPRTSHGKLDRRALPAPSPLPNAGAHPVMTPEAERLCALCADVLGIPRVTPSDNFFDLGGHSLLAMRLLNRVRTAFGVTLSVRVLFDAPTMGDVAKAIVDACPCGTAGRA